jgi:chromate transporter
MLTLFLTFLKIGAVSFGGGYGMISLLSEEVINHGWLTEPELLNFIAVSESTPGPIAINMATFIGSSQYGLLGAFLATLGVVLPAFFIILIVASLVTGLLKFAGVKAFLNGVKPVVVGLITATAITMFLSVTLGLKSIDSAISFDYKALIIFSLVAVVSVVYKRFAKKNISPILLILISAGLGLLLYGLL